MGRRRTHSSSSFLCGGGCGYQVETNGAQKKYLQSVDPKHADEKLRTEGKFDEENFLDDKRQINSRRCNKMALPRGSRDDNKMESKQMLYLSKPRNEYDNNSSKKKWSEKEIEELIFKYKKNNSYESAQKKKHFDKRHTQHYMRTNYDSNFYRDDVLFRSENDPRGVYFDRGLSAGTMEATTAPTTRADGDKVDNYVGLSPSSRRRQNLRESPDGSYYHRVSEHTDYCKRDSIISDLSCASEFLPSTCKGDNDREEGVKHRGRRTTWRDSHRCISFNSDDNRGEYSKCYKKRLSENVVEDNRRNSMDHMNQSGKLKDVGNKNGEEIDLTEEYSDEESKEKKMCRNYSKGEENLYTTFLHLTNKYEKIKNKKVENDKEDFNVDEEDMRSRIMSCKGDHLRQNKLIRDSLPSDNTSSSHFYKNRESNFDKNRELFDTDRKKKKYANIVDIENYVKGYNAKRSRFSRRDSNYKGERVFKGVPCYDDILKHSSDDFCSDGVYPIGKGSKDGIQGSSSCYPEGGKINKSLRGSSVKPFNPPHTLDEESFRGVVTRKGKNIPTYVRSGEKANHFNIDDMKIYSNRFKNMQLNDRPRSHDSNDCSTLYNYANIAKRRTTDYCDSDAHLNSSPRAYYTSAVNDACGKGRDRFSSLLSSIQTKNKSQNDDPKFSHFKSTTLRDSYVEGDYETCPLYSYTTKNTHLEKSYKEGNLPPPRGKLPSRRSRKVEDDSPVSKRNMPDVVEVENISYPDEHFHVSSRGDHHSRSHYPPIDFSGNTNDGSYGGKCRTGELPTDTQKQCLRNSWPEKKQIKNLLTYLSDQGGEERSKFLRSIGKKYLLTQGEDLLNSILKLKKMKSSRQVRHDADQGGYENHRSKKRYEKERDVNNHSWKCDPYGQSSKANVGETVSFQYLKNRSYTRPMHVRDFDVGHTQAANCTNGVDDREDFDLCDHGYSGEYGEEDIEEHTEKEERNPRSQGSSYCRDVLFLLFLYLLKILYYLVRYLLRFALLLMVYFYHAMRTKSLSTIFISVVVAVPLFLFLLSVLILSYRSVNMEFFDRDI
ncbi:conserved Plasmodium protein, unknown function [Plasmodium knowlesi strain H]|uniref:Uncharacterized protein n=3 Tax=Plasmodium knowlesi TaxID=5850 RepID=A0A5K1VHL4_PLAKH|nr:conserved Plasmodium protein, unknown function [Plasmodium knowlesi strain H]OTN67582.1 Uncharacterized protein PKNOH_S05386300 [Plasmodium knowlesi]CAA9990450.1 conserved Plasmodium protein, unknown function [Plasmodium knowlesi strain H]SBO19656.1 conserved Plasmodium protein, unknown function [Plasmodium knowlesi strain H]SBO22523.1 conserved Plasmodium protein, unknown function [Plasmodium knowlesi strain H]VVS79924.1 conserved Plasmodium protein, unknown function [Plasmodium knowlesi s|eukprot:XP_002260836.1 hypothetical protein, conserved in Plasmodium species [Plasmodium knowlesi strain H]